MKVAAIILEIFLIIVILYSLVIGHWAQVIFIGFLAFLLGATLVNWDG